MKKKPPLPLLPFLILRAKQKRQSPLLRLLIASHLIGNLHGYVFLKTILFTLVSLIDEL